MLTIVESPTTPLPLTLWGTAPGPYVPREPVLGIVRVRHEEAPSPPPRLSHGRRDR